MSIPVLETKRLILRPIRFEDAAQSQEIFPHWEIVKYMAATIPWPYPADGSEYFFKNVALIDNESGEAFNWALTLKDDTNDKLIGMISLYPNRKEDNRGFWIGLEYQRQGLMTEAAIAVNDFAFNVLGMPSLSLNNAEPNYGSHRVKEVSGAEIIERKPDHEYIAGQKYTEIRWLLTREAWAANRHRLLTPKSN